MNRLYTISAILLFSIGLVMAYVFRMERLFADAAYYFFHSINDGMPHVEHGRLVLFFSELPAVIASHMGVSLKGLIATHSIGHVLIQILLFLWVSRRLKQESHALLMAASCFIGYSHLYFSPMMEIWYGLYLLLALDALLVSNKPIRGWRVGEFLMLSLLILSSHPENVVPYLMVLLVRWVGKKLDWRRMVLGLLIIVLTFGLKYYFISDYESGKFQNAIGSSDVIWQRLLFFNSLKASIFMLIAHYWDCLLMSLLGSMILFQSEKKKEAFIYWTFLFGFILFIHVTKGAHTYSRYNQSVFLPFAGILLLLTAEGLRWARKPALHLATIAAILLSSTLWIMETIEIGHQVSQRIERLEKILAEVENKSRKVVIRDTEVEPLSMSWYMPIDALIISSLEGPEESVSVVQQKDFTYNENHKTIKADEFLFRRWEIMPVEELNGRYFSLPISEYKENETVWDFN